MVWRRCLQLSEHPVLAVTGHKLQTLTAEPSTAAVQVQHLHGAKESVSSAQT